jgi:hypothetical protein
MRCVKARVATLLVVLLIGLLEYPASASALELVVAEDKTTRYNRSLFKHWIDADKDGCNTRAEVLIEEAVVKPKIGPKCKLNGGKWLSSYDGKTITNASQLDVDHLVPLAEAWRSGAWKWSAAQRQAYANDLDNSEALIAVTLTTNRSKGDKDPSLWMPSVDQCTYIQSWISIKIKYSLTTDAKESAFIEGILASCNLGTNSKIPVPKTPEVVYEKSEDNGFEWVQINVTPYEYIYGKNTQLQGFIEESIAGNSVEVCNYDSKNGNDKFISGYPIHSNTYSIYCKVKTNSSFKFYTLALELSAGKAINPTKSTAITISVGTSPTPTPTQTTAYQIATPGAFCSPAGAIGKSTSGVTYTCKTSPTDIRNRWRQ